MAETPATPGNPFREGADLSTDAQKIALTKLLAEQGAKGAQVIQNRAQDAAALESNARAQFGGPESVPSPLYQTFSRDAAQAATNHQNEMARLTAANESYMGGVKAALPIHAKETDAYFEALRKEYEDRQAEREQAMALARARSSGGGSSSRSLSQKAQEQYGATNALQRTPSLASEAGAAGGRRDILSAAAAVGMDVNAAKRRWVDKDPKNPFAKQDAALASAIQQGIDSALAEDATWAEVMASGRELAAELGLDYVANVQPWLAMYSPLWGISDAEWVQALPKGPSEAGRSATPTKATNVSPRASGKGKPASAASNAAKKSSRKLF